MSEKRRVSVIGAGVSGMTAAYRLQQAGFDATVFEQKDVPGGRVVTFRQDGYTMDHGADAFSSSYVVYRQLLDELGLQDQIIKLPTLVGTVRDGRVVTMDTSSVWSMATAKTLSFSGKLRLAMGLKRLKPLLAKVRSSFLHEQAMLDQDTCNAESFSLRFFGREVTDYLVDPMVRLLGGTSAKFASAVSVIGDFALASGTAYTYRDGQEVFVKALAQRLSIRYGTRVTDIAEEAHGVKVRSISQSGQIQEETYDAAVVATMFEPAVEIYPFFKKITAEFRETLSYIGMMKIYLGYAVETHCKAYVIQVPTVEDAEMMVCFLDQNKCDNRAPAGRTLLHCDTDIQSTKWLITKSDRELREWASRRAEKLFPELTGHLEFCHVVRWPNMANFNAPGYFRRIAKVIEQLPARGRVQVAGDMFTKTHQEAAAAWGQRAAENIVLYQS